MSRSKEGNDSKALRIGVGAIVMLGCSYFALQLLELARAEELFGWPWGPKPDQEIIWLRALICYTLLLLGLYTRVLFSDFKVVTDRLRTRIYGIYTYLLGVSFFSLVIKYFDGSIAKWADEVTGWLGLSCVALTFYGLYLVGKVYRDVQERLLHEQELSEEFYHQLTTDRLTGLPGRMLFQEHLSQAIELAQPVDGRVAVLFLDLDDFKMFNDSLGHSFGDKVLLVVSERLIKRMTGKMRVYRLGGDEFVIILEDAKDDAEVIQVAEEVFGALEEKFHVEGQELFINLSLGISRFPEDGADAQTLFRSAEMAMYHAKRSGRNHYQLFEAAMNTRASERLLLAGDLRKAVEREEFFLCYQPQVCLNTGRITGMEALVRWRHPDRGLVSPAEFIPLAEETKLILPIGEWVLRTACRQNKAWQMAGYQPMRVAVNLSACQFGQPNLVAMIKKILADTGLEPRYLNLEITESITMNNVERAIATMHEINELGIGISIDDFGTGYSSLNYLKKFPIQTLKIDQSFVRDMSDLHHDAAIPTAIIAMAHSLNLKVVAEGVETEVQQQMLRERGCDEMQGYLISRPLPSDEFERLLHSMMTAEQTIVN